MVQFIPANNSWQNAGQQIGAGFTEGYMNRADENAVKNAVMKLGPKASARDILNALTNVNTYSPVAKQNALKNYLGVAEFEQLQDKYNIELERAKAKAEKEENKKRIKQEKEDLENEKKRNSAVELINSSDLPEEKKKEYIDQVNNNKLDLTAIKQLTKPKKEDKTKIQQDEKIESVKGGISTVQKMRDIRKKGNLGFGSNITKYLSNDALKDFGQYEQLGKSLIQQSTNIPIRNRQEFETLAHKLYDPTILDAEAEGILDALEKILSDNLKSDASVSQSAPEGKIRVRLKSNPKITGTVTPFEGMDAKYDRI